MKINFARKFFVRSTDSVSDSIEILKSNMDRLKELSEAISLEYLAKKEGNEVEYIVVDGSCTGVGLWKGTYSAVQRDELTKGTIFPLHNHGESKEILIIIRGSVLNCIDGEERLYKASEVIEVPIGKSHQMVIKEPTILIAVTIPPSKGYPDMKE